MRYIHDYRNNLDVAHDPATMPAASRILKQRHAPGPIAARLAITGLSFELPSQEEEELASRRRMPVATPSDRKRYKGHARRRHQRREFQGRRRWSEFDWAEWDCHVLKMRYSVAVFVNAHVFQLSLR